MAYIFGLFLVIVFFLAMRYFTEFDFRQQMSITLVVFSVVATAVIYNEYTKKESQHILNVALKYKQGKTLHCSGQEVNSTNYSLSTGTYTFIGLEGTDNAQEMISASDCN